MRVFSSRHWYPRAFRYEVFCYSGAFTISIIIADYNWPFPSSVFTDYVDGSVTRLVQRSVQSDSVYPICFCHSYSHDSHPLPSRFCHSWLHQRQSQLPPIQVLPQLVTSYTAQFPLRTFCQSQFVTSQMVLFSSRRLNQCWLHHSPSSPSPCFCHSSLHQSVPVRPPHVSVKVGYIIVSPSSKQRLLAEPSFRAEREHRQFKIDSAWRAACLTLGSAPRAAG